MIQMTAKAKLRIKSSQRRPTQDLNKRQDTKKANEQMAQLLTYVMLNCRKTLLALTILIHIVLHQLTAMLQ